MRSWTARLLLLATVLPSLAVFALAAETKPMHCVRKVAAPQADAMAMPCHHGAPVQPTVPEDSWQSRDCCSNHDCCRTSKISEWARPTEGLSASALAKLAPAILVGSHTAISDLSDSSHSTRAPPL